MLEILIALIQFRTLFTTAFLAFDDKLQGWYASNKFYLDNQMHLFEYHESDELVARTDFVILPPVIGADTSKYMDIGFFLTRLHLQLRKTQSRLAIVFGDDQTVDRMWEIICSDPD